jgi:hypothetical protein
MAASSRADEASVSGDEGGKGWREEGKPLCCAVSRWLLTMVLGAWWSRALHLLGKATAALQPAPTKNALSIAVTI